MITLLKYLFFYISPILLFRVKEESMIPDFQEGDLLFVSKLIYLFQNPRVNDIIVCRSPRDKKFLLKYIAKIKQDYYYVLGKNSQKSIDSRHFGWITKKEIVGKVILGIRNLESWK